MMCQWCNNEITGRESHITVPVSTGLLGLKTKTALYGHFCCLACCNAALNAAKNSGDDSYVANNFSYIGTI